MLYDKQLMPEDYPVEDKVQSYHYFIKLIKTLYIRYVQVFNKLEAVHDQTLQPQKREDIRFILEAVIGRILEIKKELSQHLGEFIDFDEELLDLKLTPEDLFFRVPKYFAESISEQIKARDAYLQLLSRTVAMEQPPFYEQEKDTTMVPFQAILVIQRNENARRARNEIKARRMVKSEKEKVEKQIVKQKLDKLGAIVIIQKHVREFLTKKKSHEQRRKEFEFLGLIPKSVENKQKKKDPLLNLSLIGIEEPDFAEEIPDGKTEYGLGKSTGSEVVKAKQNRDRRKIIQEENTKEMLQEKVELKDKILKEEGEKIVEEMHEAVLERLILFRQANESNDISSFPGTKKFMQMVAADEISAELAELKKKEKAEADAKEEEKGGKGKGKKKEEKKKDPKKKGKAGEEDEDEGAKKEPEAKPSEYKIEIMDRAQKLLELWGRKENPFDFSQKYDATLLRQELMNETGGIEDELTKRVDELIAEEMKNIKSQAAMEKKADAGKKKKPKKGKKAKKGKKKDEAGEKIPKKLDDKSNTEKILEILVLQGIVSKYPKTSLDDYFGEHRILGSQTSEWVEPSLSQVKMSVAEVILSFGSVELHKKTPYNKGILLFGPKKTGKTKLIAAIASELGAIVINLSPANISGKFQGESKKLVEWSFHLAQAQQPAIIYFDEAHVMFGKEKKTGKTKSKGPGKVNAEIIAALQAIEPGTRIMAVGETTQPWEGDLATYNSVFSKLVYVPQPDYSSCCSIWRKSIEKKIGRVPTDLNLQPLNYISSRGYPSGAIATAVNKVLVERRINRLPFRKLAIEEFLQQFTKVDPVYEADDTETKKFIAELPIKNRKIVKAEKDAIEEKLKIVKKPPPKKKK